MWTQVQKLWQNEVEAANDRGTRRAGPDLSGIAVGQAIRFKPSCPLAPLAGNSAYVLAVRQYRFGDDTLESYQLQVGRFKHFFLTIAEDAQGQYLSLSRALSETEQDRWFGRDALGFFMEPSTAKTIRCKADMATDGDWAAERYVKTVDWIEGSVTHAGGGHARSFHYNLLVNESGEKALEIEHDDQSGENRVFVTVYRPAQDIAAVEAVTAIAEPAAAPILSAVPKAELPPEVAEEVPLFREPVLSGAPKQRPDFRRNDEPVGEIRIPRTTFTPNAVEEGVSLPSFLTTRDANYLSLDEVIPPEPERVRVGLGAARNLIERAMSRNVRVRDVLRDMLGLESALAEEVIFELPLSDEDYRTLAMRYKLRPDHRAEIRARLEDELKRQLAK